MLDTELLANGTMHTFGLLSIPEETDTHADSRAVIPYISEIYLHRSTISTSRRNIPAEPIDMLVVNV